jgi:CHASE3 domain sensor protein
VPSNLSLYQRITIICRCVGKRAHPIKEEPTMDWSSEKYPWLSLLLGFALVFVWGVMSLAHAYDRGLAKVNDSFIQGFMVVDQLGVIADALARLSVDQEAFLSTGDQRFQDGVIESAETFMLDMDRLNSLAAKSKLQRSLLNSLSRSIKQVLGSVAESNEIRDVRGRVAAVAFFESKEAAISDAKSQAEQLRIEITGCVSDRIRSARGPSALFEDFLYGAPIGSGLVQKQPLLAVKQERRHSVFDASTDQFKMEVSR